MSSSSSIPSVAMDVDGPQVPTNGPGTLKRSSSAPMINEGANSMPTMSAANSSNSLSREPPSFNFFGLSQPRARRFSASYSTVPGSPPIASGLRRIHQLRQEEDINNLRELAHEKETHQSMQISQSWEDLTLMGESQSSNESKAFKLSPLHVQLPPYGMISNSPSPRRISSPSFQSPTRASRNNTFIRRSASPVLRPSPLGVKRKLDDDKQDGGTYPAPKRVYSYSVGDRGLLTTSSLTTGSLSSVGTPESLSSADSPGFSFRNMDSPSPNRSMQSEPMMVSKSDERMNDNPS